MGNVQDARREMTKTKEQLEEEKKISLSIRIKPLDLDAMDHDQLQGKAGELWETIVRLETEKYDLEERQKRQDYDVSKLPPTPTFYTVKRTIWSIGKLNGQIWPLLRQ